MRSQIAEPLSAPVRSRPDSSVEEIREEQKQPPPDPPLPSGIAADPVPLEVRRFRVAALGSKRKRDVATVRIANELARLETLGEIAPSPDAFAAWDTARSAIRALVPTATFSLWIEPITLVGAQGDTLFLDAPPEKRSWIERRYSNLIAEELAQCSEYRRVSFGGATS